jgi:hypothetical protein
VEELNTEVGIVKEEWRERFGFPLSADSQKLFSNSLLVNLSKTKL